ncbi:MAG: hypothetical protein QM647_01165 [Asticcacaulis sp.]|uniref:hypothetical protein n=1 Tax=Asticcacaulis sp. TaxID=1872648 RepID=UPI0039E33FE4
MDVFPSVAADAAATIATDMDRHGYGVVENCIPSDLLSGLRQFIEDRVQKNGGEYIAFSAAELAGTLLQELSRSANFQQVCRQLYESGTRKPAPPVSFYNILRCLAGQTGEQNAYFFHYDSYVLTILVPILIPTEGQPGDLIMFPNTRPLRKTYFGNLIDKFFLDNRLMQTHLRKGVLSGGLKPEKIRMTPGNVYFFWGYRSVHANESCDPDKIRATALYHYVDPHSDSWLRNTLLSLRGRKPQMSQPVAVAQPA